MSQVQTISDNRGGGVNLFSLSTIIIMLLYILPQSMLFVKNDMLAIIVTAYYVLLVSKYVSPVIVIRSLLFATPFLLLYWLNGFPGDIKHGLVLPFMTLITLIIPCYAIVALIKRNNYSEQRFILIVTGLCLLYVTVSTFQALSTNSYVMREDAGGVDELYIYNRMKGIGGYGIAYSLGALFIALFGVRKLIKRSFIPPYIYFVILIASGMLVVLSQYATLLFITLFGVSLYFLIDAKTGVQRIIVVLITIIVLLLSQTIVRLGMQLLNLDILSFKFELIYDGIWGESGVENISGERSQLQINALDLFLTSPIFGSSGFINNEAYYRSHSTVLSVMASTGLIGLISYFMLFYSAVKLIVKTCFTSEYVKKRYYPVLFFYFAFAFLNPVDFTFECSWVIFMVIPLLLVVVDRK